MKVYGGLGGEIEQPSINLTGIAHSNNRFRVTGTSVFQSYAGAPSRASTASNDISVSGTNVTGNVSRNVPVKPVPSARDFINNYSGPKVSACYVPPDSTACPVPQGTTVPNCGGTVFYCAGNAFVTQSIKDAVVIATGTIDQSGSSVLGADGRTPTVALIAGGDIVISGSNNTYGVFWAQGDIRQSGSSAVGGKLISGGTIRRSGGFTFEQYDGFGFDSDNNNNASSPIIAWSGS